MLSEEKTRESILRALPALPARRVPLARALNTFLAEEVLATISLPGFDNSAMDGYAVRAQDVQPTGRLLVRGEQPAGVDRGLILQPGEAIRIFTGAPIPAGADAVLMQEDVTRDGQYIMSNQTIAPGEFVRRQGCDLATGQRLAERGDRVTPTLLALLASQGLKSIPAGGAVKAAIISTGDELTEPGQALQPGQIYDSNSTLLNALVQKTGATVAMSEHCRDEKKLLADAIARGAKNHVLILSGGVSVGEHDLVKDVITSLGGRIELWRVALKPGKPFLFGQIGKCAVFGLPGNPVSTFVTFLKFVRPAILQMMGGRGAALELRKLPARLTDAVRNDGARAHYVRGNFLDGDFSPFGRQESHALFGLSRANALLRLEPDSELAAGAAVTAELLD